jgi:hypothetical protein
MIQKTHLKAYAVGFSLNFQKPFSHFRFKDRASIEIITESTSTLE